MLTRLCIDCRVEKPLIDFNKTSRGRLLRYCSPCRKARRRASGETEYARQRQRSARAADPGLAERDRKASRAWQNANRDTMRELCRDWRRRNPEAHKIAKRRWADEHPGYAAAKQMKRHAAKMQRTPSWLTAADHARIRDYYVLAAFLSTVTGQVHHVDHIVPLQGKAVSGLHVPWNLQVILGVENSRKCNKEPHESDYLGVQVGRVNGRSRGLEAGDGHV